MFQIQSGFTAMKYFSDDLREVRSVSCLICGLVVKNDGFRPHVKREHHGFHYKTLDKLVKEGRLELNYQYYHRCYYCYKEMVFTENKIIGHLSSKEHKKINNMPWSEYRDRHLTHKGDVFSQPNVGSLV